MKSENMGQKCPECNCVDKKISRRSNRKNHPETAYIQHIPEGDVGIIRCSHCGYIFEYCTNRKPPLEVKKILV